MQETFFECTNDLNEKDSRNLWFCSFGTFDRGLRSVRTPFSRSLAHASWVKDSPPARGCQRITNSTKSTRLSPDSICRPYECAPNYANSAQWDARSVHIVFGTSLSSIVEIKGFLIGCTITTKARAVVLQFLIFDTRYGIKPAQLICDRAAFYRDHRCPYDVHFRVFQSTGS